MLSLTVSFVLALVGCRSVEKPAGHDTSDSDPPDTDSVETGDSDREDTDSAGGDSTPVADDTGGGAPSGPLDEGGATSAIYGLGPSDSISLGTPADVDGDGALDVLVSSRLDNAIHVFLGPAQRGSRFVTDSDVRLAGDLYVGPTLAVPSEDVLLVVQSNGTARETRIVPLPRTADVDLAGSLQSWVGDGWPWGTSTDASGDGRADLLFADPESAIGGATYGGAAWLVDGPVDVGGVVGDVARAFYYDTLSGAQAGWSNAFFDADGDGVDDLALGVPEYYRFLYVAPADGRVVVSSSADAGSVSTTDMLTLSGTPGSNSFFGYDLSSGDVDSDGYDDLLVSAENSDIVYLFLGPITASGSASSAAATITHPLADGTDFGSALSEPADINGDGAVDVAIGAVDYPKSDVSSVDGEVWVATGPFTGVVELEKDTNARRFTTSEPMDALGLNLLTLTDIDADGIPDLGASVPQYDTEHADAGAVFFYSGRYF